MQSARGVFRHQRYQLHPRERFARYGGKTLDLKSIRIGLVYRIAAYRYYPSSVRVYERIFLHGNDARRFD